jgi:hypothetical protein
VTKTLGGLVEANVRFDPAEVARFGFQGEAAQAGDVADLVEELQGGFHPRGVPITAAAGTGNRLSRPGPQSAIRYQLPWEGGIVDKNPVRKNVSRCQSSQPFTRTR